MKNRREADKTAAEQAIRNFIADPIGAKLKLDVSWVTQARRACQPHLVDAGGFFFCGTRYVYEENTNGRLLEIALKERNDDCVPTHSVEFIFSDSAEFILCKKCLKWLRKQLAPALKKNGSYQERVGAWMLACFGEMVAADVIERNHRFLEEALELVQSCGCSKDEAHELVEYVFNRPPGEKSQEVGGVMVTLAAVCLAQKLDMLEAAETELARVWKKIDEIRAKQAAKPKRGPLPVK